MYYKVLECNKEFHVLNDVDLGVPIKDIYIYIYVCVCVCVRARVMFGYLTAPLQLQMLHDVH
jgi:hypothetical protein